MKFSEFEKIVREVAGGYYSHWCGGVSEDGQNLVMSTNTGGVSGGSCWEDSDPRPYYNSFAKREVDHLKNLLDRLDSELLYSDYRKIEALIKTDNHTEYEYYGNCEDYILESINIKDMWAILEPYFNKRK